jgi:hypothetical protein
MSRIWVRMIQTHREENDGSDGSDEVYTTSLKDARGHLYSRLDIWSSS